VYVPCTTQFSPNARLSLRARFFLIFIFTALAEKFSFMFLLHSRLNNMLVCFFIFFFLSDSFLCPLLLYFLFHGSFDKETDAKKNK